MRVSPAEPLRDGTTEFTFIFNVFGSVSLTVADAATDVCWDAVSTDQFIRLELLGCLLSLDAIFHSSKVGLFAFETLVISQFEHGPALEIIMEISSCFHHSIVFVYTLMRGSLNSLFLYVLLNCEYFFNLRVDGWAHGSVHKLLALSAVKETELYSGR